MFNMPSLPPPRRALARWGPAALVFGMFFVYSAVQAPVPGVNEPQYLGKAKHFWDPSWAANDFFLDTSNPHLVFYVSVGWLTRFLSLEATAWVARAAGYALVALGWTVLAGRLCGTRWAAPPAAAIFLLLASIGNFSGEWLIGGIEGKVFAYGFLFAAIALWLAGRLTPAAACLGGAVSFHPVVGMWGLVCLVVSEIALRWRDDRPSVAECRRWGTAAVVFLVTALPGLIPAVLTLDGTTAVDVARANYIQVFIRLRHHLDPMQFAPVRYVGYGILLAAWLLLLFTARSRRFETTIGAERRFLAFVLVSVAIAIIGVAIGWYGESAWTMPLRNLRTALLKFYPFRLADLFVPIAFAMTAAALLVRRKRKETDTEESCTSEIVETKRDVHAPRHADKHRSGITYPITATLVTVVAFTASLLNASPDRNPSRMSPVRLEAWIDVARWVRQTTPPGAIIVAPSRQWGFKWYAHRAEYVNHKDAPQDTAGLLEWERRRGILKRWWESSSDGRFDAAALRRLGTQTGADYLVTLADRRRFLVEPVYENGIYQVYPLE